MHRLLPTVGLLITTAACLTTVDQRWCDSSTPCTPGFVCTSTFHCVPGAPVRDAGVGGGAGGGGGGVALGGGAGGGQPIGGGGGPIGGGVACDGITCAGCCQGSQCITADRQSQLVCGASGRRCEPCNVFEACTPRSGCVPLAVPDAGSGAPGSPCEDDSECGADGFGQCIPEFADWPGGYCTRSCDVDACPMGAECIEADSGGQPVFICLAACQTDNQCRPGYACVRLENSGVCVPD